MAEVTPSDQTPPDATPMHEGRGAVFTARAASGRDQDGDTPEQGEHLI